MVDDSDVGDIFRMFMPGDGNAEKIFFFKLELIK